MGARVNARRQTLALATLMLILSPASAQEPPASDAAPPEVETPWPYELKDGTTIITVYQPQLDSWDGVKLKARAVPVVGTVRLGLVVGTAVLRYLSSAVLGCRRRAGRRGCVGSRRLGRHDGQHV